MELWDSAVRMVSSLVLVLGVILGLLALTRTVLGRRLLAPVGSPLIRVLGSSYIGPRKSVLVLAVAGEVLIIGTTATDVIPLGRLTDPEHIKQALSQSGTGLYVPQTVAKAVSGDL
ncbi:MAG: flagellar biosynthetic protein FliO [Nitrospiraceae bacterium]